MVVVIVYPHKQFNCNTARIVTTTTIKKIKPLILSSDINTHKKPTQNETKTKQNKQQQKHKQSKLNRSSI